MKRLALFAVALVVAATGCHEPHSVLVKRPENTDVDAAVTAMWSSEIHGVAQDGDWILSRSYFLLADGISKATGGVDLSHASIYDAKRDTVIEAVGSGVREIPLSQLIQRNHYVIVVRPSGMTEAERAHSVERARSRLGTEFDKGGLFGFDDKDKLYCSELVWWAAQGELRTGDHHRVITPSGLMEYGQVVYWSGQRTDQQVMDLAMARDAQPDRTHYAAN
ncbi:MAG TPA: YiiX/YebB-like N1pC/P60 family cysteine hydrolase [Kofleriaceae bacterium]